MNQLSLLLVNTNFSSYNNIHVMGKTVQTKFESLQKLIFPPYFCVHMKDFCGKMCAL